MPLGRVLGARPLLRRERNTSWRIIAWGAVLLVHILFFTIFLVSQNDAALQRTLLPLETELLLTPRSQIPVPRVPLVRPTVPNAQAPQIVTAPITLPPIVPAPPTTREILESIGRALACGAGSYETLPAADRARCLHRPWRGKRLANGTEVLDMPPKPAPPSTDFHISGGDFQRRQTETVNPCPILAVTPCIHKEIYGDGPGHGIPAPF
jgi:hypothetical protein